MPPTSVFAQAGTVEAPDDEGVARRLGDRAGELHARGIRPDLDDLGDAAAARRGDDVAGGRARHRAGLRAGWHSRSGRRRAAARSSRRSASPLPLNGVPRDRDRPGRGGRRSTRMPPAIGGPNGVPAAAGLGPRRERRIGAVACADGERHGRRWRCPGSVVHTDGRADADGVDLARDARHRDHVGLDLAARHRCRTASHSMRSRPSSGSALRPLRRRRDHVGPDRTRRVDGVGEPDRVAGLHRTRTAFAWPLPGVGTVHVVAAHVDVASTALPAGSTSAIS